MPPLVEHIFPESRRVLFVIGSLDIGGAEKQLCLLASGLCARGWQCRVFCLQPGGAFVPMLQSAGVPVCHGGMRPGDLKRQPHKLALSAAHLAALTHRFRPRVLHAFLPLVTFVGALCGRALQVPLVITSRRALGTHQERFFFLRPLDVAAGRMSHWVTVNSQAVADDTLRRERLDPARIIRIYNGIETQRYARSSAARHKTRQQLGVDQHAAVVIMVANLIAYKGHGDFLRAFAQVTRRIKHAVAWLVGEDRGILHDLQDLAARLGIRNKTHWLGQRRDIPALLGAADVSVLSSHEEGFSNVILESMAAGLPVVATRVGGNAEALIHGLTGCLVPPRQPGMLADSIIDLLAHPEKAARMGCLARQRARRLFSVEQMIAAHQRLYIEAKRVGKT